MSEATGGDTPRPSDNPLTGPYWTAAQDRRLVVQRCLSCEQLRWPPLVGCPECLSRDTAWVEVSPNGTIWSYVVYNRAFSAALAADIPYTVAIVQLDDGPHMVGRLIASSRPHAVGDRVTAEFVDTDVGTSVHWRRA